MSDSDSGQRIFPARTPGPLGLNDQADPNVFSELGKTPGPTGLHDYAELLSCAPPLKPPMKVHELSEAPADAFPSKRPISGAIPVGIGAAAKVRIPIAIVLNLFWPSPSR